MLHRDARQNRYRQSRCSLIDRPDSHREFNARHRPAAEAVRQDLCPRCQTGILTRTKEPVGAECTEAFTISKPPGSTVLKWNKTSMLPTQPGHTHTHIYMCMASPPSRKGSSILGCIYVSLLHTRRFDKKPALLEGATRASFGGQKGGIESYVSATLESRVATRIRE